MPVWRHAFSRDARSQRGLGVWGPAGGHQPGCRSGGCPGAAVHGGGCDTSRQETESEGAGLRDHEQPLQARLPEGEPHIHPGAEEHQ